VNEFGSNVERHRRELLVHCYRMLGSLPDAEDAVQETLLRHVVAVNSSSAPSDVVKALAKKMQKERLYSSCSARNPKNDFASCEGVGTGPPSGKCVNDYRRTAVST
jgi:hypothetical protein